MVLLAVSCSKIMFTQVEKLEAVVEAGALVVVVEKDQKVPHPQREISND